MTLKKILTTLHLWLGLASGLIVFIVSITGAIYVFEREIREITEPWKLVEVQPEPFLLPGKLSEKARKILKDKQPTSILYGRAHEAASVSAAGEKKGTSTVVYLNPYNGSILHTEQKSRSNDADFFRFILNGHMQLWLPRETGSQIVGGAVLLYVFLLLSGLYLWWPRRWNSSVRNKSFQIKWKASLKRVIYDLHNVLGFYLSLVLLLIALTGMVYSFKWYSRSVYWLSSGGNKLIEKDEPMSDTTAKTAFSPSHIDLLYQRIKTAERPEGMMILLPVKPADPISFRVYPKSGQLYNTNRYAFDQYTLKLIPGASPFSGRYEDAGAADRLRRMNYDLHTGAMFGLPGKILSLLAALVSASLPVTGFLIWNGKKVKKKKV